VREEKESEIAEDKHYVLQSRAMGRRGRDGMKIVQYLQTWQLIEPCQQVMEINISGYEPLGNSPISTI